MIEAFLLSKEILYFVKVVALEPLVKEFILTYVEEVLSFYPFT